MGSLALRGPCASQTGRGPRRPHGCCSRNLIPNCLAHPLLDGSLRGDQEPYGGRDRHNQEEADQSEPMLLTQSRPLWAQVWNRSGAGWEGEPQGSAVEEGRGGVHVLVVGGREVG